ncbi:hypothetical protein A8H39_00150 [Paraburkholderia fungorum]|uniref:hypothetical protein n=1 Tax=Paraburkholderia fungorum TaxID=134537 RepID=UPI0004888D5A|nr:hypothetical protein [Paraburkholderia fungorum]PNE59596.1 hypothetical protein A8H39_00150 [Paraburkholderia fungorum]
MLDTRRVISLFLGVVLVTGLGISIGRLVGKSDGIESRQRLEIVWPDLMQMPDQDRALLASLALTCHLKDRNKDQAAVLSCLEEAVDDEHPRFPYGMDRKQARDRLNDLIPQPLRTKAAR